MANHERQEREQALVRVTAEMLAAVRHAAAVAAPEECCGILLGHGATISAAVAARNVHPAPRTHFEIDPQALIDAHRAARAGGPQVLGYYHSHPAGPPEPSATDRAMAAQDGRVWAIVGQRGDIAMWRDAQSGFVRLSYAIAGG